jgi:hypothetical protein
MIGALMTRLIGRSDDADGQVTAADRLAAETVELQRRPGDDRQDHE